MSANQELFQLFQIDNWYPLRISMDQYGDKRLTQGKISMFGKGFLFHKGEAKFPTEFQIVDKSIDSNGYLILKGRLRDNDDHDFRLALDTDEEGETFSKCGYNSKGDWVIVELRHNLSYGKGESLCEGRIKVFRDPDTYSLLTTEDKKCLQKGNIGEKVFIYISHTSVPE